MTIAAYQTPSSSKTNQQHCHVWGSHVKYWRCHHAAIEMYFSCMIWNWPNKFFILRWAHLYNIYKLKRKERHLKWSQGDRRKNVLKSTTNRCDLEPYTCKSRLHRVLTGDRSHKIKLFESNRRSIVANKRETRKMRAAFRLQNAIPSHLDNNCLDNNCGNSSGLRSDRLFIYGQQMKLSMERWWLWWL